MLNPGKINYRLGVGRISVADESVEYFRKKQAASTGK